MPQPVPSRLSRALVPPVTDPQVFRYFERIAQHPFRSTASRFDLLNASRLADCSLLAYADPTFVRHQFAAAGFQLTGTQPLSGPSTQCYVAHSDRAVIVAFRGTQFSLPGLLPADRLLDEISDFLVDAQAELVMVDPPSFGRVHRGFQSALHQILVPLTKHLASLRQENPNRTVWLTGHSLGGALAVLAAAHIPETRAVFIYGAPRVGDDDFQANYRTPTFSFVHGDDLVTKILLTGVYAPPRLRQSGFLIIPDLLGFYRHVGERRQITRNGEIGPLTESNTDLLHQDIFDHSPLFYAVHLWNAVERSL